MHRPAAAAEMAAAKFPAIGTTVDLLRGLAPDAGRDWPVFPAPLQPLTLAPAQAPDDPGAWGDVEVSLHDGYDALLDRMARIVVAPFRAEAGHYRIPPSALTGPRALSDRDPSGWIPQAPAHEPGRGFMLVKVDRIAARVCHEVLDIPGAAVGFDRARHIAPEGWRAMVRLRPGRRRRIAGREDVVIGPRDAAGYLEFFAAWGSHFLSELTFGDSLMQVFAYPPDRFAAVRREFESRLQQTPDQTASPTATLRGIEAAALIDFTAPPWLAGQGAVFSRGIDPALPEVRALGLFRDPRRSQSENLLRLAELGPETTARRLAPLTVSRPIGFILTSLDRFMEYFRAVAARRVLKGALAQAFGPRLAMPLVERPLSRPTVGVARGRGWSLGGAIPAILHRETIRLEKAPSGLAALCADHVIAEADIDRAGQPGLVLCDVLQGAANTADAPHVRCASLSAHPFHLRRMEGALVLVSPDGKSRNIVVDGLRFAGGAADPSAGTSEVRIAGALAEPRPVPEAVLRGFLRHRLARIDQDLNAGLAPADVSDAIARLHFLATQPTLSASADIQALRRRAALLACEALHAADAVFPDAEPAFVEAAAELMGLASRNSPDLADAYRAVLASALADARRRRADAEIAADLPPAQDIDRRAAFQPAALPSADLAILLAVSAPAIWDDSLIGRGRRCLADISAQAASAFAEDLNHPPSRRLASAFGAAAAADLAAVGAAASVHGLSLEIERRRPIRKTEALLDVERAGLIARIRRRANLSWADLEEEAALCLPAIPDFGVEASPS